MTSCLEWTEGTQCTCTNWCRQERNSTYGICTNGDSCICSHSPLTNVNAGKSDCDYTTADEKKQVHFVLF
jgi:hypothetical protein